MTPREIDVVIPWVEQEERWWTSLLLAAADPDKQERMNAATRNRDAFRALRDLLETMR